MQTWLRRVPGGLMIVPLLLGTLLNTIDQQHFSWIEQFLHGLGAPAIEDPETKAIHYEFLKIGGFVSALVGKDAATTLIAVFLVCVASQMDFRIGRQALKKGCLITITKLLIAIGCGYALSYWSDEFNGFLGLSLVSIIAAMSNGNGGLYLALTNEYGDRTDVGAIAVISLNDGPFFTLLALGMLGERFPVIAFLAVLLPMLLGFLLGQWNESFRKFLRPGEKLCIPFFAFALGTTMNLAVFLESRVLAGGLFLGIATVCLTGSGCVLVLWVFGSKQPIAGWAEASTAGNAVQTPSMVAVAAQQAVAQDTMMPDRAQAYQDLVSVASAQISIAVLTTAILCPAVVLLWHYWTGSTQATANPNELN